MTIAEEIKKTLFKENKETIKSYIRKAIIETAKKYPNRVVGFEVRQDKIAKPCMTYKSDSPFPQIIAHIYVPEVMALAELTKWLKDEGFEWESYGGVFAWRLK